MILDKTYYDIVFSLSKHQSVKSFVSSVLFALKKMPTEKVKGNISQVELSVIKSNAQIIN